MATYTDVQVRNAIKGIHEPSVWDDLRVAAGSTEANGSNPPTDALFVNDGNAVAGDSYSLSFLSTVLGTLTLPDNVVFDTSADFTFECWVRPVVGSENTEFLRKRDVFELDFIGTDQIQLDVKGGGVTTSTVSFSRGSWNFIVLQHDVTEGETRLYINNILAATIAANTVDSIRDFEINRNKTLFDIDYIAYWNTLLTASELTTRYSAGAGLQLAGNEVGLQGLWELNDATGTTVIEKTGISTDGTISGGSEGVEWSWIVGHVGNLVGNSRGVILKYFSPTIINELYFDVQLPHKWHEGSNIRPHVHWVPNADGTAKQVTWGLEYTWCQIGDVFGDTTVITGSTEINGTDILKNKHSLTPLGEIDATGKTISSMLVCRVFRDPEDVDDTFDDFAALLEVDFHYLIDSSGSEFEVKK